MHENQKDLKEHILFFDGVCGLCNKSVDFLLEKDRGKYIFYSPLQGKTIDLLDLNIDKSNLESLVFYSRGKVYKKSRAVAQISSLLPYPWKLGQLAKYFPKIIADWIYTLIAKNRYRLFGKKESCRLPTPEEREYFLD